MAVFKNPNSPVQPQAGVYGWFAEKDDIVRIAIYVGMAGKKGSFIGKGTLFRGVSELQRNTFTSNSPHYDKLDTDFIVGTAIRFFERKGYACFWEHLSDDPTEELKIASSEKPILQNVKDAKIKNEFRVAKSQKGYWHGKKNLVGVEEAESEVFCALERVTCEPPAAPYVGNCAVSKPDVDRRPLPPEEKGVTEINYCKMRWKSEIRTKFELPDLEYPVPSESFETILSTGNVMFEDMLYWLQDYSSTHPKEWLECESAILRLSELIAPQEKGPDNLKVAGDNWSLLFSSVDLTKEVVTIQRGDHLIAAIQNAGNGQLMVSAYRPLDCKSVRYLTSLALNPQPDGTVCMRPNNWEYALDCSFGTGNIYAAEAGASYLSYWEFGLGFYKNGSKSEEWSLKQDLEPIAAKFAVMQVGTCYEKAGNWD